MTPFHLEILFWYYTRGGDFESIENNETRRAYAYQLAKFGYLYTPEENRHFAITDYGKSICNSIINYFDCLTKEAK